MFVYGSFVTIFLLLHGWCGATRADAAGQDTNTDVKLALIEKDIENIKSVLNAVLKQVQAIGSKQQTIETRQQNMESTLATKIQIVNLRDEKLIQGLNIQVKEMIEKDATLSTKQQAMEAQVSTIYRRLFQLAGSTQQPLSTKSTNCGCKEELSRMNSTGAALHSAMLTEQSAFQSRLTSQLTQLNHTANKCSCQYDIDRLNSALSNIYKVMNHSWTAKSTDMQDELLGYWSFDSDFEDQSTNGYSGTPYNGAVVSTDSYALGGGALLLDFSNDVQIAGLQNYVWGTKLSVSVWFKRTGLDGAYSSVVGNGWWTDGSWDIRCQRTEVCGCTLTTAPDTKSHQGWEYTASAPINEWHHVVFTYDGDTPLLSFYMNGVQQSGSLSTHNSGAPVQKNQPVYIGRNTYKNEERFRGYIDELRIYNKALDVEDVMWLYYQGRNAV